MSLNVAVVGSPGSGKTSLIRKWKDGRYSYDVENTVDWETVEAIKHVTETKYSIRFTDFSSNSNRNTSAVGQAFKKADCVLLLFDSLAEGFYGEATHLIAMVGSHCLVEPPVVFARTRVDLLPSLNSHKLEKLSEVLSEMQSLCDVVESKHDKGEGRKEGQENIRRFRFERRKRRRTVEIRDREGRGTQVEGQRGDEHSGGRFGPQDGFATRSRLPNDRNSAFDGFDERAYSWRFEPKNEKTRRTKVRRRRR